MSNRVSVASGIVLTLLAVGLIHPPLQAQDKKLAQDKAARLVLDGARRAYSDSRFDTAAQQFAEFIRLYPARTEATAASYGMGLALLRHKTHASITGAVAAFRKASEPVDFADRPLAIYYLGVSLRDLATSTLAQPLKNASDYRPSYATQYRQEAARHFAAAADAFIARSKKSTPTTTPAVHPDVIWAAQAKSDQCDMLLRIGQHKQAIVLARSILDDKVAAAKFGQRATYNLGYAHFALKDYQSAGKTLSKLAPFAQTFGPHGRYLLARSHHLAGDMPEASVLYKAIITDYAARKAIAVKASQNRYRSLPAGQRAAAAALVAGPPEPFIVRSIFYSALGQAESGQFGAATSGFTEFITTYPKHPLATEARMRLGYCQMQLKSYTEAIKTLDPMRKNPKMADRARWWIARSRVGAANPEIPQTYAQTLTAAITELKSAAQSAHNSGRTDPKMYVLSRDIMMELGDTQILAGKYKDACTSYGQVVQYATDRSEEATQRLATAYHLGGDYARSDSTCKSFMQKYPKSTLTAAIWFRSAENACMAAINTKTTYNRSQADLDQPFKEAVTRYQRLLDKFPDFSEINLAKYGLATAQYRLRWYNEALQTLAGIPAADCTDKLTAVPYLIADCNIRTFPTSTNNALTAGQLMTQAAKSAKLLEGFVSANAKSPKAPDALLKLGYCYQRLGSVVADAKAKKNAYTQGKTAYANIIKNYPKDPLVPTAMLEQAKCMVLLGDSKSAANELDRFQRDPYRQTPVAPLAIVQYSSLLRAAKRAIDAERIGRECLALHEKEASRDPKRHKWLIPLRYEYALAVMDTGKIPEARGLFTSLTKKYPGTPEAVNSLWRIGQCQRRELQAAMETHAKPGGDNDANRSALSKAVTGMITVAQQLTDQAKAQAKIARGAPARLRLLYEAAWCYRILGEREHKSAKLKIQKDAMRMAWSRQSPRASRPPENTLTLPKVSPENVPVQESEAQAMKLYSELIALVPQAPLAARSRFELAEMLAHKREHDKATELLQTILENSPPEDLAQMARIRLTACLLDRGDPKRAMTLIKLISAKAKGDELGHVKYLTGEAYIQQKDWSKAVEELKVFRDIDTYRRMYSISDRGLLRLGYAYQQIGNWPESRRAFESLASYMPKSPWYYEARFGDARARENSNDYDNARIIYADITAKTATIIAAQAKLRIGYCNAIQKKYPEAVKAFLSVPYTYNYPECSAEALYQAGAAQLTAKLPDQAAKSWTQLIKDYPKSKWASQGQKQLSLLPVKK
ncbi:MAG: tetratricopeptide repeat protein [Phycisphaerales bacterium]|jgi:cellulose synthase operon protein C|nr:tetratricopeptide repeat protein [Phycisphaerales bacterium]